MDFACGVFHREGLAFGDEEAVVDDAGDLAEGLGEGIEFGGGLGGVWGDGQVEDVPGVVGDDGLAGRVVGGLGSAERVGVVGRWGEAQMSEGAEGGFAGEGDDLDGEEALFAEALGEL